MAATHTSGTLQSSASNTAGSTTTSSTLDNSAGYGAIVTAKITNGGTGPTIACTATLNVSPDGTTFFFYASQTAGTAASGVYGMAFEVPPAAIKANVVFTGNTGQTVTVEAQYQLLSAV